MLKEVFKDKIINAKILFVCILITAAWFSVGYYNPDEHYQILEFANYKLGLSPESELAWEFNNISRQAIQPFVAYLFGSILIKIQLYNPFLLAFILRLISAALSFSALNLLIKNFIDSKHQVRGWMLAILLGFMPFLLVRFSSESCSGAIFFIALCLLSNKENSYHDLYFVGLLLGIAFYCRFQTAFAIAPLLLWYSLFIAKLEWRKYGCLIFGFLTAIGIGILIDFWFYETWVFTPYNYLNSQIFKGVLNQFGVSPWWYYPILLSQAISTFYAVLIILVTIVFILNNPTNVISWISLVVVGFHTIIGHKEIRFLFPLILVLPITFNFAIVNLEYYLSNRTFSLSYFKVFKIALIIIGILFMLVCTLKPVEKTVVIMEYIYQSSRNQKTYIYTLDGYTFRGKQIMGKYASGYVVNNFYKNNQTNMMYVNAQFDIEDLRKRPNSYLFIDEINDKAFLIKNISKLKRIKSSIPEWIRYFNINNWQSRDSIFSLYQLK